jgi:hypothetical protein
MVEVADAFADAGHSVGVGWSDEPFPVNESENNLGNPESGATT